MMDMLMHIVGFAERNQKGSFIVVFFTNYLIILYSG